MASDSLRMDTESIKVCLIGAKLSMAIELALAHVWQVGREGELKVCLQEDHQRGSFSEGSPETELILR